MTEKYRSSKSDGTASDFDWRNKPNKRPRQWRLSNRELIFLALITGFAMLLTVFYKTTTAKAEFELLRDQIDSLSLRLQRAEAELLDMDDRSKTSTASKWVQIRRNSVEYEFDTQCEYRWECLSGIHAGKVFYATQVRSDLLLSSTPDATIAVQSYQIDRYKSDRDDGRMRLFRRCN